MASGNGLVARALGARTGPRRAQSDVAGQESPGPSPPPGSVPRRSRSAA